MSVHVILLSWGGHHAKQFSASSNVHLAKTESPLESQGHLPPTTFHHIQDANAQRNLPS